MTVPISDSLSASSLAARQQEAAGDAAAAAVIHVAEATVVEALGPEVDSDRDGDIEGTTGTATASTSEKKKKRRQRKKKKPQADSEEQAASNTPAPRKPKPLFIDDPSWTGRKVIPAGWTIANADASNGTENHETSDHGDVERSQDRSSDGTRADASAAVVSDDKPAWVGATSTAAPTPLVRHTKAAPGPAAPTNEAAPTVGSAFPGSGAKAGRRRWDASEGLRMMEEAERREEAIRLRLAAAAAAASSGSATGSVDIHGDAAIDDLAAMSDGETVVPPTNVGGRGAGARSSRSEATTFIGPSPSLTSASTPLWSQQPTNASSGWSGPSTERVRSRWDEPVVGVSFLGADMMQSWAEQDQLRQHRRDNRLEELD
ncbi:hypothetical protein DFJ73DRAFT_883532 [Zopfochytrium polystomum]|nr:hypothetical protein DFJ73DRAFT_883532 [Zopfochytrium polystomum]